VKDETISIWLEIGLRAKSDFKNPYYSKPGERLSKIPVTDFYKMRVWKEYFFKFSDSANDPQYVMDSNEQLDVKMSQIQDRNTLLSSLYRQITILQSELQL
jgi:hypothetical protein